MTDLHTINDEIAKAEHRLGQLYVERRGRVEYDGNGNIVRAWCSCCGIWPVKEGADTCDTCRLNRCIGGHGGH